VDFVIQIDGDKRVIRKLDGIPKKLRPALSKELKGIGKHVSSYITRQKLSGQVLNRRTGMLARSIKDRVISNINELYTQIGTDVPYAGIHERGGTITPKHGRWLWIPTKSVQTKAGVTRQGIRDYVNEPDTFFQLTKRGTLGLFRNMGKGNPPDLLFIAKSYVNIPKRPYMRPSLEDNRNLIISRIKKAIGESLK